MGQRGPSYFRYRGEVAEFQSQLPLTERRCLPKIPSGAQLTRSRDASELAGEVKCDAIESAND